MIWALLMFQIRPSTKVYTSLPQNKNKSHRFFATVKDALYFIHVAAGIPSNETKESGGRLPHSKGWALHTKLTPSSTLKIQPSPHFHHTPKTHRTPFIPPHATCPKNEEFQPGIALLYPRSRSSPENLL